MKKMEDIFQRLVELNKEITYKFGTEAYDIRCKLYDIIQDGRKKVNNSVLDDVSKQSELLKAFIDFYNYRNTGDKTINNDEIEIFIDSL